MNATISFLSEKLLNEGVYMVLLVPEVMGWIKLIELIELDKVD